MHKARLRVDSLRGCKPSTHVHIHGNNTFDNLMIRPLLIGQNGSITGAPYPPKNRMKTNQSLPMSKALNPFMKAEIKELGVMG